MIHAQAIAVLGDNYVWVLRGAGSARAAVVDPGHGPPVVRELERAGLALGAILLTHHHADHVAGVPDLLELASVPVYGPAREAIPGVDHPVREGDVIEAAGARFAVLDVPGHTAGHVAYHGDGFLLSGDTLFAGGCGRLFEGTAEQMAGSLAALAALDPETRVCCGHEYTVANLRFAHEVEPDNGELVDRLASAEELRAAGRPTLPSTIGIERLTNPFLRCSEPSVVAAAARRLERQPESKVEVFAAIRQWKDGWRG